MQPENEGVINFYRKENDYGYFSNFYPSPFTVNEIKYATN